MTCLTKGQKTKRPRCEAQSTRGGRCKFQGKEFQDGKFVCGRHPKKPEPGRVPPCTTNEA